MFNSLTEHWTQRRTQALRSDARASEVRAPERRAWVRGCTKRRCNGLGSHSPPVLLTDYLHPFPQATSQPAWKPVWPEWRDNFQACLQIPLSKTPYLHRNPRTKSKVIIWWSSVTTKIRSLPLTILLSEPQPSVLNLLTVSSFHELSQHH